MKVIMAETFDGRLMINVFDELFYAREIRLSEEISKEFDYMEEETYTPFQRVLP